MPGVITRRRLPRPGGALPGTGARPAGCAPPCCRRRPGAARLRDAVEPDPLGRGGPPQGAPGFVRGFLGGIATEDPAAALAGRQVLSAGGTAVDAAVAAGFVMTVTLPSRVGLGGGGACLVFDPAKAAVEAVHVPARCPHRHPGRAPTARRRCR